jgi:hypothetical protein
MSDIDPLAKIARENRLRLAQEANERAMQHDTNRLIAVRANMARLRELRLGNEALEVRTEIAKANQPAKTNTKKRF